CGICSTMIVTPRRAILASVTTVASWACTRPESISTEKPCAKSKCTVRPRGVPASFLRARRCSRLKPPTEDDRRPRSLRDGGGEFQLVRPDNPQQIERRDHL